MKTQLLTTIIVLATTMTAEANNARDKIRDLKKSTNGFQVITHHIANMTGASTFEVTRDLSNLGEGLEAEAKRQSRVELGIDDSEFESQSIYKSQQKKESLERYFFLRNERCAIYSWTYSSDKGLKKGDGMAVGDVSTSKGYPSLDLGIIDESGEPVEMITIALYMAQKNVYVSCRADQVGLNSTLKDLEIALGGAMKIRKN